MTVSGIARSLGLLRESQDRGRHARAGAAAAYGTAWPPAHETARITLPPPDPVVFGPPGAWQNGPYDSCGEFRSCAGCGVTWRGDGECWAPGHGTEAG